MRMILFKDFYKMMIPKEFRLSRFIMKFNILKGDSNIRSISKIVIFFQNSLLEIFENLLISFLKFGIFILDSRPKGEMYNILCLIDLISFRKWKYACSSRYIKQIDLVINDEYSNNKHGW